MRFRKKWGVTNINGVFQMAGTVDEVALTLSREGVRNGHCQGKRENGSGVMWNEFVEGFKNKG